MSADPAHNGHGAQETQETPQSPPSPEQLEADITAQREHLAETIDALTAKLDVKSQAKAKAADVRDRATTDSGKPRPELLVGAGVLVVAVVGLWWWRHQR